MHATEATLNGIYSGSTDRPLLELSALPSFPFLFIANLQSCAHACLSDLATACRLPSIGKPAVTLCRGPLGSNVERRG